MNPAEALCCALDWDWGDPAQRQVCEEAADVVCRIEREACAHVADQYDRKYKAALPDADWILSAEDIVQGQLMRSLHRHVPGWCGATDEQLLEVAREVIDALDKTPRARIKTPRARIKTPRARI